MRVVGQPVPGKNNVLSPRVPALAINWKRVALYTTLAAGFFILGFIPMWFKVTHAGEQRDVAQREVRLLQLRNTLAAAVINVQRDQYEPARQLTSDFYTNLRGQID